MNHPVAQIVVRCLCLTAFISSVSLLTTHIILKRNIDKKIQELDRTARLVANQIKTANINSILAFTGEHFIFIVHQRDGRLLFESAQRPEGEKAVWEQLKIPLISEMIQNKEGWLYFPNKRVWQFLSLQKAIRYVYLTDLNWIVAVEVPASVSWHRLASIYSPVVWGALISFCFIVTVLLFPLKKERPVIAPKQEIKSFQATGTENKLTVRLVEEAKKMLEENKMPTAQQEAQPAIEHANEEEKPQIKEVKKPAVVYFEKIMEKKSKKLQPDTIIGRALSKKSNREKMGS
ncbi:MAG TPA: hypothetical protein VI749_02860 [Candidatus Omnitrophota bacterium]|nr:hypothetical protein [Candidatus Omnitrophota bacterium]